MDRFINFDPSITYRLAKKSSKILNRRYRKVPIQNNWIDHTVGC